MSPSQRKRANALIHRLCCNCLDGQCIILDCECPQRISYSVCCKHFRHCVLLQDKSLFAEVIEADKKKKCTICGKSFVPKSNRAKYCSNCAVTERKKKKAKNERKYRQLKRGRLEG